MPAFYRSSRLITRKSLAPLLGLLIALCGLPASGQENNATEESPANQQDELFDKFSKTLTGCKFVGSFTVTGRETGDLTPEEYHIKSVVKMDAPDMWLFTARIKYSEKDISVPLPLQVKWAGDTPVITLTDFSILGQGPFSARVVIYDNMYAGTWSHGDHGGHLFGDIVAGAAEGVDVEKTRREQESAGDDQSSDGR